MKISKKNIRGIDLVYIHASKYKHMLIGICLNSKINQNNYNQLNMLPSLLEENNRIYKTTNQLNVALDYLYGATFFTSIYQRGHLFSNQFFLKLINEKYVENEEDLIESAFSLIKNIIFDPKKYKHKLTKKAVDDKIKETYEAMNTIKQDKATLAYVNFVKKISGDLPLIFPLENQLDLVDQNSMTQVYQQLIQQDQLKIYVIGDFHESVFDQVIGHVFNDYVPSQNRDDIQLSLPFNHDGSLIEWVDYDDVSISRVYLGYHIIVERNTKEADTIELLSRIIGGDSQSKLFMTIREEMQLVYMIYSSYLYEINTLMIHFESEAKDENVAIDRIKEIILKISNGDISEDEIQRAKRSQIKSYRSVSDSLYGLLKLNINEDIMKNSSFNLDDRIKAVESVTKEDMIKLAQKLSLSHLYKFVKEEPANE